MKNFLSTFHWTPSKTIPKHKSCPKIEKPYMKIYAGKTFFLVIFFILIALNSFFYQFLVAKCHYDAITRSYSSQLKLEDIEYNLPYPTENKAWNFVKESVNYLSRSFKRKRGVSPRHAIIRRLISKTSGKKRLSFDNKEMEFTEIFSCCLNTFLKSSCFCTYQLWNLRGKIYFPWKWFVFI